MPIQTNSYKNCESGSALVFILLMLTVVVLGMSWFISHKENQRLSNLAFHSGEHFGITVNAAHRYVRDKQQSYITTLNVQSPRSISLKTLKTEGYLPANLKDTNRFHQKASINVTLHPDGTPLVWVGVTEGRPIPVDKISVFIAGAQIQGITSEFWQSGGSSALASSLGFETKDGMPWTTSAKAIPYNSSLVYRNRIPGHAQASTMYTDLELGTGTDKNSIKSVKAIENTKIDLSSWLRSNGDITVSKDALAKGEISTQAITISDYIKVQGTTDINSLVNTLSTETSELQGKAIQTGTLSTVSTLTTENLAISETLSVEGEYTTETSLKTNSLASTNSTFSGNINTKGIETDRLSTENLDATNITSPSGYSKTSNTKNITVNSCIGCPDPGGP